MCSPICAFEGQCWAANHRVLETISLREGGLKQSRIVEDGFLKNRRAEIATTHMEMAGLSVFMSLTQSDILTSRFTFQTHAPVEFRKSFADRLPGSAFRDKPCHDTIDVSGVRGNNRTPDWLTCSPATRTKHHLEPYLLTAVRSAGSRNLTENTRTMNLLPNHEPVLIEPLVPDSVLPGQWFLVLGVCASTAVLVWPVKEVARIHETSIFEPLADDSAEAMLKLLFNLEWHA